MNRYRADMTICVPVTMTVTTPAEDPIHARRYARDAARNMYPTAERISVDRVTELSERAPTPDPLAQARDIIAGLLDAADCGAQELESLAIDALSDPEDQPESDEDAFRQTRELRADYDRRSTEAWKAIEAASAFLAKP